jgi:hypothetical protein
MLLDGRADDDDIARAELGVPISVSKVDVIANDSLLCGVLFLGDFPIKVSRVDVIAIVFVP